MSKTGNTRYRIGLFGKIILQIEWTYEKTHDLGGSGYFDTSTITVWRDAKPADILQSPVPSV